MVTEQDLFRARGRGFHDAQQTLTGQANVVLPARDPHDLLVLITGSYSHYRYRLQACFAQMAVQYNADS